jgi:peptidoglycan/LPS O-acetylase OafA/YrhL
MKRLELLDYGRFFAAFFVVLFHWTFNGIASGKIVSIGHTPFLFEATRYGYLGVEFFFMISGYVIFYSSRSRTAAQFSVSRAVRLYPSYWFAVLFTSFFTWAWGGDLMTVSPSQIIVNLSMVQYYLGVESVEEVYWTLLYEIKFYALIFVFLLLGLQKKLNAFFILWPVIMMFAFILGYDNIQFLGQYFPYFSAGALFAYLNENKSTKAIVSLIISYFLCLQYSMAFAVEKTESTGFFFSEYVVAGLITCFYIFFYLQNTDKVKSLKLPLSKTLGALTYPVYLIHAHFGYIVINKFATEDNKVIIYIVVGLVVLLVSYLMNRIIEIALAPFWKKLFMAIVHKAVTYIQELLARVPFTHKNSID